jgi:predicted porin
MKKKILAAALVASLPLFAQAQSSVTMYGIVDASVGIEDNDAPGQDSSFVVQSGTQSTSRFGFRGTEELGNGLKALFNIEADVNVDTGAGNATLFQRRAVVGLEGGFGTVTVGREYSPAAAIAQASDALGHGFYGSSLASFVGTDRLTRRLSNSVNYKSKAWNGITVGAAYSAGEQQVGDSRDLKGVSLEATNFGIYLGAAYQETDLPGGKKKEFASGAGYKWSDFEVRAGYLVADPTGSNNAYEQLNVGGSYAMGPNKFFVQAQRQELGNGAKGTGFTLAYTYTLSKRTNLYSTFATLRNNNIGTFGLTSAGGTFAPPATALGADPKVFNVGVRHSF